MPQQSCQKLHRHVQKYSRALQTCLEVYCMTLTQSALCSTGDTILYYQESNVQKSSGLVSNSQHHVSPVIHCTPIIRVMQNFIVYITDMVVISRATQACCNVMVVMSKAAQTCLEVLQSITDMSRGLQHDFDTVSNHVSPVIHYFTIMRVMSRGLQDWFQTVSTMYHR